MKHLHIVAAASAGLLVMAACSTDLENIEVQRPLTYDAQYYQNLRDFHASDHEVSYAYYEAWSPIEGVKGYKDPASWGERFIGLPDSIDIVNLWMGIPSPDSTETNYAPVAYADMQLCREQKGIRFVSHSDASHYRHKFTVDGVEYDMGGSAGPSDTIMAMYARSIVDAVFKYNLDGTDIDFEGWSGSDLTRLVKECAKYIGPKSPHPEKLLIVDFFGGSPDGACDEYCDYFVQQAYSNQAGIGHYSQLTPEKLIYCESFGVFYDTGGKLRDYARYEPGDGHHKGGCGVFFLGRNYYGDKSGRPYGAFREAIQIMNPAIHK